MTSKKLFEIRVYETENFEIKQNWEVPIPAFFILACKRKARSLTDFTDEEAHEMMDALRKVRKAMRDVLGIRKVCLFHNEGSEFNFHAWLLPRYEWMDKIGRGSASLAPIIQYAKENMMKDRDIKNVKDAARKIKDYLEG